MRLFLLLIVLLSAVAIATSKNCKKLEGKFAKKCLKKGFEPKTLENCEIGDGVLKKKAVKKCVKMEKKIIAADCDVKLCAGPDPTPKPIPSWVRWCRHEDSYLYTYVGPSFDNLDDAKIACYNNAFCNGITQVNLS